MGIALCQTHIGVATQTPTRGDGPLRHANCGLPQRMPPSVSSLCPYLAAAADVAPEPSALAIGRSAQPDLQA
eukprot:364644-Chlamydomonas_euryale.AAC.8